MSVHDDGAPRWSDPEKKEEVSPRWADEVSKRADALLDSRVKTRSNITSLDFKVELRRQCTDLEPPALILQEDVSRFLKRWFLKDGEHGGYAFREHEVTAEEKKQGKTVYNEYFYAGVKTELTSAADASRETERLTERVEQVAETGDLLWWLNRLKRGGR